VEVDIVEGVVVLLLLVLVLVVVLLLLVLLLVVLQDPGTQISLNGSKYVFVGQTSSETTYEPLQL
jgi:hypothetical protein